LEVEGGTFYRTYDELFDDAGNQVGDGILSGDGGPVGEADPATVSTFRLDKYLVTVGRFRQFVNAAFPRDGGAGWLPAAGSGKHAHLNRGSGLLLDVAASYNNTGALLDGGVTYEPGWVTSNDGEIAPTDANLASCSGDGFGQGAGAGSYSTWTPSVGTQESLPINCVNSAEAHAFCIWDGGFLPTYAEWEYAAAGGSLQRYYPWGSTEPRADNRYAIYGSGDGNCYYPTGALAPCTGVLNIAPVGTASLGAGFWGQLDLLGNLDELTLDANTFPVVDPCVDCAVVFPGWTGLALGFVGEDFIQPTLATVESFGGAGDGSTRDSQTGFRCARHP
jgi:formylglycine-generating enzyme required for sulfatase activity